MSVPADRSDPRKGSAPAEAVTSSTDVVRSRRSAPPRVSGAENPLNPRLLAWLLRWQFQINTLASVAIEYPRLRPALKRLQGEP